MQQTEVAPRVDSSRSVPPLRAVRRAQGLSLREAGRRASIDASQLSRIERGEGSLSIDALARLSSVLGLQQLAALLEQYRPPNGGPS